MKNLSRSNLVHKSLIELGNENAKLTNTGALSVRTGQHTGRSPNAKFIVEDDVTKDLVDWNNNQKMSEREYKLFRDYFLTKVSDDPGFVYTQQVFAGQHDNHKIPLQVFTSKAWQSLFVKNMFVAPTSEELENFKPEFTLYCIPEATDVPRVVISFKEKLILIGGTWYAGEMKKSMFTVLNFLYPQKDILPMHCSVNVSLAQDNKGDISTIFFGLSGTGKTTLSSDEESFLVGDDEHGWSDDGLFNFEGGCYAKVINLSKKAEPVIYEASQQFGAILENVEVDKKGFVNFDSNKWTENTRASYPLEFISTWPEKVAEHPKNIIMLTCDAYGILPPVAKLTPNQAVRQFLLGYTAKVAGTEKGITEPQPTFSHCFGSPFMPMRPKVYADLLRKKIKDHNVNCWLVNTGWTGGPYGVGERMPINLTRSIVDLIRYGALRECEFRKHTYTDLNIPVDCKEIPENILKPELGWEDKQEYTKKAKELMAKFTERLKTMHL
jgi:phosphoenolpyruvate carboxykinase (ATP)